MTNRLDRPLFLLCAVLLLLALTGCTLKRSYEVKGRVLGFGDDGRTLIIEHEEIPGFMPAMTMSFKALDRDALTGVGRRDAVRFTLVVTRDSSWIYDLQRLPDSAVAAYPAGSPAVALDTLSTPASLLGPGDPTPPVPLVNQDGEAFTLADFEGRALVLTFIYTRCPLPDYCPLMSRQFQRLQPRLAERFGARVHLLSISFDPAYDTPDVLRAYARRYTDDTTRWTFATGSPEQITRAARLFGVFYEADGVQFNHNLATVLIGPDGRVQRIWRGNDWQPDDVLEAVAETLPAGGA